MVIRILESEQRFKEHFHQDPRTHELDHDAGKAVYPLS
jgi:hypothetical protein